MATRPQCWTTTGLARRGREYHVGAHRARTGGAVLLSENFDGSPLHDLFGGLLAAARVCRKYRTEIFDRQAVHGARPVQKILDHHHTPSGGLPPYSSKLSLIEEA